MFGIFGSPYRAEAIAAMQREISSPDHPITQDFLQTLTELQMVGEAQADPSTFSRALQDWLYLRHQRGVMKAALTATVAALPKKVGRARALTVEALLTDKSELLDQKQMRRQLIAAWSDLPKGTRGALIRNDWPLLAGPEMLPILRDMVSLPAPHFGNQGSFACYGLSLAQCSVVESRNTALKRIFELDAAEGRLLILRDLSDPNAQPSMSLVRLLTAGERSPIVKRAVQRIETGNARAWDYSIVELFGDKSTLGWMEGQFKAAIDQLHEGHCDPHTESMLRYFLRVDPQVGARDVQASLGAKEAAGCYPTLLESLGKSLQAVEQLAISELDSADVNVASDAARALGRWGTAKAEPALWARLRRFHQEWPTGLGDFPLAGNHTIAQVQALDSFEATLVQSIVSGTNWTCGPAKLIRLDTLVSPEQRVTLSTLIGEWDGEDGPLIITPDYWGEDDRETFSVMPLPYMNLDDEQIRTKLSQMPRGSKLYFQTFTPGQMSSQVSMGKQQAVLEGLRKYAAQFGVTVEERPH